MTMRKKLSWVATICYPARQPIEFGNVETFDFDPEFVRSEFNRVIPLYLPSGFEIVAIRRGRIVLLDESNNEGVILSGDSQ